MALKITPNLSRDILQPSHFEKMKVSSAMHVSCVRQRNPVPTPVGFSYALCAIIVGQFLSTKTDTYVLYHLAASIVKKFISNSTDCEKCQVAITDSNESPDGEHSILLRLKALKRMSVSLMELPNAVVLLEREAMLLDRRFPSCHDLEKKKKFTTRYIRLRLQIESESITTARKEHSVDSGYLGSKSRRAKKTKYPSGPTAVTTKPLQSTMLIAMDILGLSIVCPPAASGSGSLVAPTASSSLHQPQ